MVGSTMESDFVRDILETWNRLVESSSTTGCSAVAMDDIDLICACHHGALTKVHSNDVTYSSNGTMKPSSRQKVHLDTIKDTLNCNLVSPRCQTGCYTNRIAMHKTKQTPRKLKDRKDEGRVTMSTNMSNGFYGNMSLDTHTDDQGNVTIQSHNFSPDLASSLNVHTHESADGRFVQPCPAIMDLTLSDNSDDKKRPLSVSSVTSSVSSSSSLPRHQRKKLATCVVMSSAQASHLNNISIEEDHVHSSQSCDEFQKYLNQNRIDIKDYTLDGIETKDSGSLASESTSISRDISAENFSENSSSDISDLSALSSVSAHNNDNTEQETQPDTASNDGTAIVRKRGTVVKSYTPLCDPHGRAPRTTLPSVTTQETLLEAARAWSSHTYKVIQEIVITERVYVRDLQDIVQGYVAHLADCDEIKGRLSKQDLNHLFGNIMHIYVFSRELLESLEQCGCDPVKIAQCFVDHSQGFSIYTHYCTNYPRSVEVLTAVMCDAGLAEVFRSQQTRLQHGLPLGSYLLKPVQRILKYHLLLQNLMNNFDVRQSGYDTVYRALQCMTNVAQHTNEMKRRHERAVHIQEIQSLLFGWTGDDLTTYGDLVLEDTFRMHGAKAYRHLYLFEKVLIIAKRKEDGNLLVKESIQCSNLMVIESVPKEPLCFHVIPFDNPKMQYTIQTRNLEQKHKWCQHIKKVILDNFSAVIPDTAKKIVLNLGRSKEEKEFEESQAEESATTKGKQHTAPEYLERRRQRRKSSATLLDLSLLKGQRVFRMRRQSSADGRLAEAGMQSPRLLIRTNSAGNMLDLNESPQEQDEDQPGLRKAESIESLHSPETSTSAPEKPPASPQPSAATKPLLCSAAQSTRRVQSRDLLDAIDDRVTSHDGVENVESSQSNNGHDITHGGDESLPSSCIVSQQSSGDKNAESLSPKSCKKVPQKRDSLLYIDDSDSQSEDTLNRHSFLRSLSAPTESILQAVANQTGIVLSDDQVPASPTDPLRQYPNDACVVLPQLKETKIGSDDQCNSTQTHIHLNSSFDSDTISQEFGNDSLRKKPPVGVKTSPAGKSKLLTTDKSVQDRILCDSDISSSLAILGVNPHKRDSYDGGKRRSLVKSMSTDSQHSLCSNSSHAIRLSSDLNKDGSRTHLNSTELIGNRDPWTPRNDLSNRLRRLKDNEKRGRNSDHRRSKSNVGDLSLLRTVLANKQRLNRASSCSSLDGKDEQNSDEIATNTALNTQDTIEHEVKPENSHQSVLSEKANSPHSQEKSPSSPPKKIGGSSSFREKFRNMVIPKRYTTPTRDEMKQAAAAISQNNHCAMESSDLETEEKVTVLDGDLNDSTMSDDLCGSPRGSGSKSSTLVSRDSTLDWSAFNDMEEEEAESTEAAHKTRSPRPHSYNEHMQHSIQPVAAPAVSNESIINSLKNAMVSLTSRITRMGNSGTRSAYTSPAQGFVRSRSLGAENDARINKSATLDTPSPHGNARASPSRSLTPAAKNTKERRKEKRSKLVYNLQRAYSERMKKRGRTKSQSPVTHRNSKLYFQDPSLFESTTSINAGERLAEARPQGLGSLTLRKPKPKGKAKSNANTKEANCESDGLNLTCKTSEAASKPDTVTLDNGTFQSESNTEDICKTHTNSNPPTPTSIAGAFKIFQGSNPSLRDGLFLPSDIMDLVKQSGQSPFDDCASLQSYYEQTLEANLDSDSMRDFTVFSEESGPTSFDSDSLVYVPEIPLPTIFDTVQEYGKSVEAANSTDNLSQETENSSKAIHNIVQSLEIASKTSETQTHQAQKVHIQDRSRELKECAMLSRIRQNSCDGTLDKSNSSSDSNVTIESPSLVCTCRGFTEADENGLSGSMDDLENSAEHCPVHSSPKKGWVKQVISQIQSGYLSSEN